MRGWASRCGATQRSPGVRPQHLAEVVPDRLLVGRHLWPLQGRAKREAGQGHCSAAAELAAAVQQHRPERGRSSKCARRHRHPPAPYLRNDCAVNVADCVAPLLHQPHCLLEEDVAAGSREAGVGGDGGPEPPVTCCGCKPLGPFAQWLSAWFRSMMAPAGALPARVGVREQLADVWQA